MYNKKVIKKNARANALFNLKADDDEYMRNLRILTAEREKLADQITDVKNKSDIFKEILSCTSKEDIQHVYEEFFSQKSSESKFKMSSEQKNLLTRRFSHLHKYKFQEHAGVSVQTVNDKSIVVAFLPFPNYTPPELCLLKFELKRKKYILKLVHFYLPDGIPVDKFETLYLSEESQDVPTFIHAIHQCLWCYWTRDFQVFIIKNEIYMKNSIIYHNRSRTVISFTIHFLEKFNIEVSLRYEPTSHLPTTVQFLEMDEQIYPNQLEIALRELKNSLLHHSLSSVLKVNLDNEMREESISSGITSSSISQAIELFK